MHEDASLGAKQLFLGFTSINRFVGHRNSLILLTQQVDLVVISGQTVLLLKEISKEIASE